MHAHTHAYAQSRTHAYAQSRPRAAEAAPHCALRHGHRPGQRSPAGGTCWLRLRRGPRRQPGREVQRAVPAVPASPAGPHVPFWDTAPPPQAGGSLTSHRTGPLRPGGLCPAQASVASFHFGVRSFPDDPSLIGGILVGSAVPSLQSPEIHPRLWHLPCSGAGPQPGGAQGRGVLGWSLGSAPLPLGLLTCSGVPCVLLMWIT